MSDFFQAAKAARSKANPSQKDASLLAAMRTTVYMAKEDLAMQKYPSLIEFQKIQKCPDILNLRQADNASYESVSSGKDFQSSISEVIHKDLVLELKKAKMFSILIDESTDIAISKHLVVYIRFVKEDFEPKTVFLKNVTISDPKSTAQVIFDHLMSALEEDGIDITKCIGFGSDGAAVMVGKDKGVAALVKKASPHCLDLHCMAHRLNLASSQASDNIPYLKTFEKTLSGLFYYFGGSKSGNRKCGLEAVQKILNDPQLKIKECHQIRWLAFMEAVRTVLECWKSIREYFRKTKDENKKDSKALEFYKTFSEYKFVAVLYMLMDILPSVSTFSMVLQKRDLDVSSVFPALKGLEDDIQKAKEGNGQYQKKFLTMLDVKRDKESKKILTVSFKDQLLNFEKDMRKITDELKEIRTQFCDQLLANLKTRFPTDKRDMTCAFGALAMRTLPFLKVEERKTFGDDKLETILNHFGNDKLNEKGEIVSKRLVDPVACRAEWSLAKQYVLDNSYLRYSTQVLYSQLKEYHEGLLPNLLILAELTLILPLQTADCERGFSAQNAIVTARRSCLGEDSINTLMTIKLEGSLQDEHTLTKSLSHWRAKKPRRV